MGKKETAPWTVGALVFAKVKGYPAWPAKVVDITKSKKYSVYFYGTGETANVQAKDISLYVATKQKFATSSAMKKADFKAAIDQIEAALSGQDGAPTSYEIPLDQSNATFDSTINSTFDNTVNHTLDNSEFGLNSTKAEDSQLEDDIDDGDAEPEPEPEAEAETESIGREEIPDIKQDVEDVKQDEDTEAFIAEPETVETPTAPQSELETPKVDIKLEDKKQSRSGRIIKKTKYLHDEFEQETPQARTVKRNRPSEGQTPIAKMPRLTDDSLVGEDSNEGEIKQVSQLIMSEVNLLQYDVDIKSSLQLSSADTSRCISVLEKYKNLEVTALMLKKNSQVAETIKRLRRYVGNTKEWNFTEEQRVEFNEKAAKIRKLAEIIYKNFKKLFTFPPHVPFWQGFTDEVQSFKEETKGLSHEELITLTEDVQPPANQNIEVKNSIRI